jgi:hypothetical protein
MTPISPREHEKRIEAGAREAFAKHRLKRVDKDRWFIRRPDCGNHAAEIGLLGWGRILVHGDCPDVLYGHCSYRGERLIPWLANSEASYLTSKVIAGVAREWVPEVALDWIDVEIRGARMRVDDDGDDALERFSSLLSVRRNLASNEYDDRAFRDALYELSGDFEFGLNAGYAPSSDLIYTREAARTLIRLLNKSAIPGSP